MPRVTPISLKEAVEEAPFELPAFEAPAAPIAPVRAPVAAPVQTRAPAPAAPVQHAPEPTQARTLPKPENTGDLFGSDLDDELEIPAFLLKARS